MSEIRDPSLWKSGKMKIDWVRANMPLLRSIREEFEKTRPFEGLRVALSIHLEAKTAYLSKVLALLMVLVLVAGMFAGCAQQPAQTTTDKSGNETNTTETETDTTTETETTETRPNRVIYGSTTGLSGDLGNAWWTNNADDKTLRDLIDDYSTVSYNQDGALVMNATTAASIDSVMNEDGTKTFTVKINEGLVYNNGEPITRRAHHRRRLCGL